MSFARARALRGLHSALRSSTSRATPRVSAPARTQLAVGRRYASEGGHGHAEPSSDVPWLVSAVVITVPACYFLMGDSLSTHADAGHHGGHDEHTEEHEEHEEVEAKGEGEAKEEGEPKEEEAPQADTAPGEEAPKEEGEQTQEKGEQQEDKAAEGKDTTDEQEKAKESEDDAKPASGSQGDSQPNAPDGTNKESAPPEIEGQEKKAGGSSGAAGTDGKGRMKEDSDGQSDTRKRESDSKGGFKKRIDSGLQKDLGGSEKQFDDPEGVTPRKESSQPAKPPLKGSEGDITGKQFGLSNTPTRHSLQIDQDPEKSKKPEGGPDTAKAMGPIDPNRPAS